jgi:hypothetical protein
MSLKNTGFVSVKVLDDKKQLLYSKTTDDYDKIAKEIKAIDHHIVYDDAESNFKFIHNHIENRFYVQLLEPALLTDGKQGYIKVLYRVSDAESKKAYMGILYNVLLCTTGYCHCHHSFCYTLPYYYLSKQKTFTTYTVFG